MKKLVLVVFSALLPILGLEAAGWAWESIQASGPFAWELVASRRMRWTTHDTPGVGYTLIEPGSRYEWLGVEVNVNSEGLRGRETPVEKPDGVYRILNLGDSVAMGWAVDFDQAYGPRLERTLQEGGRPVEVVNAAVPGWNLENAAAYYRARGAAYEPDFVIFEVTLANDVYGEGALTAHKRPPIIEWLRANTCFWPFVTTMTQGVRARATGREPLNLLEPPSDMSYYFPESCEEQVYEQVWESIAAVGAEAQAADAGFLVLLVPLELQVVDGAASRAAQACLSARAASAGIEVVDLDEIYRQACMAKGLGPCTTADGYLFADRWMHPSSLGHELAARALAEAMTDVAD